MSLKNNMNMTLEDFEKQGGLLPIEGQTHDDILIVGNIDSDRTDYLSKNISNYTPLRVVSFCESISSSTESVYKCFIKAQRIQLSYGEQYNTKEFLIWYKSLCADLKKKKRMNITVDLNSLGRELLLFLSSALFRLEGDYSIRFIYFSSKEYDEAKWESLKHKSATILATTPGNPSFGCTALVALLGFGTNAIRKIVETYKPDYLFIGYNKEGVTKVAEKHNKVELSKLLEEYKSNVDLRMETFQCDVKRPDECFRDIKRIIETYRSNGFECQHIKLAALNTKLSLAGATLVSTFDSDVQMVYAKPIDFCERTFSKGIAEYFEFIYRKGDFCENN